MNSNRRTINDLNVFPIPDGDTGDNMYMTIRSGCDAAGNGPESNISQVAQALSGGMLLGARGNSGVILSRIFAGMSKGLGDLEECDSVAFGKAMQEGVAEAYRSVAVPVEGTMLTVLKDAVRSAGNSGCDTFEGYFNALCESASESLERTPDLLPVLKEAGVVDSGGAGLLHIFEGMRDALSGYVARTDGDTSGAGAGPASVVLSAFTEDSVLEFGYCTEFLLRLQTSKVGDTALFDESVILEYLQSAGESLVFFRDGSIIKVHVHTRTPGEILNTCQKWGEYLTVKVENMTLQHHGNHMEKKLSRGLRKKYAVVTVASGEGIVGIMKDTGADFVIEGGQTMNPSAESFLEAFETLNADVVYVLPNNSNIILTARQAASLYEGSDVRVIETRSVGEGYVVLGSVDFSGTDIDSVVSEAEETASAVVTGMVSTAVRDTKDAVKGDFIGFKGSDILSHSKDRNEAVRGLCSGMNAGDADVLVLFKGRDVPQQEADSLLEDLQGCLRNTEVVMTDGGQPVYDYILILE